MGSDDPTSPGGGWGTSVGRRLRGALGCRRSIREFGSEDNLDKLLQYERRLKIFMQRTPALSGICLYHRDTLPSYAIETALITHPSLYISATLSQLNSRYVAQLAESRMPRVFARGR